MSNDVYQLRSFREIVIITTSNTDLLAKQKSVFEEDVVGFRERDLKTTVCMDDSCKKKFQSYLKEGNNFQVLLIGKDGGVKATWNRLVQTKEVFALIDAMPMRKSEMKRNP